MPDLVWQEVRGGYVATGYSLTHEDGSWRLESPGSARDIASASSPIVTFHSTADEGKRWAAQLEREEVERLAIVMHFTVAAVALAAFALLAEVIGSMVGLALVATAFYVMLRSAANGAGLILKDAWGWTRHGPQRRTLLERMVHGVASRRRRRTLGHVAAAPSPVRPLSVDGPSSLRGRR